MSELRLRPAVRAIVVDPDDRFVLVRFDFPGRVVWAAPGGGIEEGEDADAALVRELEEELGLVVTVDALGPLVWTRTHVVPIGAGRWDGQTEQYRLQRVGVAFDVRPRMGWERLRAEGVAEIRWWTLDELLDASRVEFAPRGLPALLQTLLRDGPPDVPIDVGV
jgi:ADP-ribose pyrophosphatase YjhB (NUDIX family)